MTWLECWCHYLYLNELKENCVQELSRTRTFNYKILLASHCRSAGRTVLK